MTILPSTISPSSATTASQSDTSTNPLNQLDNTQTFLQLLVAQLENQSPDNPEDPSTFMSEISQLANVEAQTNLASEEQVVAADSMIGFDVSGKAADGSPVSGVVTGVLLGATGTPDLTIGNLGEQVALTSVTQVQQVQPASSGSSLQNGASSDGTPGSSGSSSTGSLSNSQTTSST